MAEETKKSVVEASCATDEVVKSDVPVAEKEVVPQPELVVPEAEKVEKPVEEVVEGEKDEAVDENKITESVSFKEESNKVDDLIDPQKKALDEFKKLIQEAIIKYEFTTPPTPPPAPAKEEEKKKPEEESKPEEKKEEESKPEEKKEGEPKPEACEAPVEAPIPPAAEPVKEEPVETKPEEKPSVPVVAVEKVEAALEEIKETIVHEDTGVVPQQPPTEECPPAPKEEDKPTEEMPAEETAPPPPPPEVVELWGYPLLANEKSDVILLKFLRARDFKVKEALAMLKSVVAWRKKFKIDELLEEEGIGEGLERVAYIHGMDKEGHPVCYNAFGEFQDKELYNKTLSDAEKRSKFLRWYIQFLEKNIRKLDFSPDGTCTIVQITDLKSSPGLFLFKTELRQATNQALQLLQDNYPEFVAKQVFINVPWWYVAYNRMISPFLTQRTKSKFVFASPAKTAETLFKYIAPEQVPVQYGGLSKEGETEFTNADPATEETIKPTSKHTIEWPITEACTLEWEVRVLGWDVYYGAEFIPSTEGGYTKIVQKSRKIGPADEHVISCSFKIGEVGKVVLTFDNQTSKKKKLFYRSKTKHSD
ncbi:unnamed protein product [Fraxinus pennsylvanica]|uniref:Patellin-3 n=1 Tax=Fraxinus pennsylvanica TaxID=56036 RepID=A0AAD1ZAB7_9LAMI|nr:unnamed protein product [Fraxinus pennsylvanica]